MGTNAVNVVLEAEVVDQFRANLVELLASGCRDEQARAVRIVGQLVQQAADLRRVARERRAIAEAELLELDRILGEATSAWNHATGGLAYLLDPANDSSGAVDVDYWTTLEASIPPLRQRLARIR